ncbi:hypothetical protein BH24PSE2_BH24PSE2_05590 [soil metagenome]
MMSRTAGALAAMILLLPLTLSGQDSPNEAPSERLEAAQAEADDAFDGGRYEEAYDLYLDDLVPIGDKYAQYMIGLMHLRGLGIEKDVPLGAAWLELAAERGDEKLGAERDAVLAGLDEQQRKQQQALFKDLQAQYSDCALVSRGLEEDRKKVTATTGSRLAQSDNSPLTILYLNEPDDRLTQAELREQIRKRQRFLREYCDYR